MARLGRSRKDPFALMAEGKPGAAVKVLKRMIRKDPADLGLRIHLADALQANGNVLEAVTILTEEGESCLQSGFQHKGLSLIKKALRWDPDNQGLKDLISGEESPAAKEKEGFTFDIDEEEEALARTGVQTPSPKEDPPIDKVDPPPEMETPEPSLKSSTPREPGPSMDEPIELPAPEEEPKEEVVGASPPSLSAEKATSEIPEIESLPEVDVEEVESDSSLENRTDLLNTIFPLLEKEKLRQLAGILTSRTISPKEVLIREGEASNSLFIVEKGTLNVKGSFQGKALSFGDLAEGSVLGEVAFLNQVPRTATVTAQNEVCVLELTDQAVMDEFRDDPPFRATLEEILISRVRKTISQIHKESES